MEQSLLEWITAQFTASLEQYRSLLLQHDALALGGIDNASSLPLSHGDASLEHSPSPEPPNASLRERYISEITRAQQCFDIRFNATQRTIELLDFVDLQITQQRQVFVTTYAAIDREGDLTYQAYEQDLRARTAERSELNSRIESKSSRRNAILEAQKTYESDPLFCYFRDTVPWGVLRPLHATVARYSGMVEQITRYQGLLRVYDDSNPSQDKNSLAEKQGEIERLEKIMGDHVKAREQPCITALVTLDELLEIREVVLETYDTQITTFQDSVALARDIRALTDYTDDYGLSEETKRRLLLLHSDLGRAADQLSKYAQALFIFREYDPSRIAWSDHGKMKTAVTRFSVEDYFDLSRALESLKTDLPSQDEQYIRTVLQNRE